MAFSIIVAPLAQQDIDEYALLIAEDSMDRAKKWKAEIQNLVLSLSNLPERHALIPEASTLGRQLRSIPFRSHRIVYEVDAQSSIVNVVRIYHTSRDFLSPDDL